MDSDRLKDREMRGTAPRRAYRRRYDSPTVKDYGSIPDRTLANNMAGFDGAAMGSNQST